MLTIYTRSNNPITKEFLKSCLKKILGKYSGPDAVLDSLKRGLNELNIPFVVNPFKNKNVNIHVLAGAKALREAINKKRNNQILIAGPNILTVPTKHNNIISDPKIDIILTPSKWVTDYYIRLLPALKNKIYSWPSGVKIPNSMTTKNGKVLVIKKDIPFSIFENIIKTLNKMSVSYEVLVYGKFLHEDYLKKLETAPYLIYLQSSESQGLALQEAWSYNVPTLVFQNTKWTYEDQTWQDPKIAAPYLVDELGYFFNLENLEERLRKIESFQGNPQKYCLENLSDKKSAELLLNIINDYREKNN